jgi:hypothetical protein
MKYQIYVKDQFHKEYTDKNIKNMEKELEKLSKKYKDKIRVAKIPENIGVGYDIYRNGKYYGSIVSESEYLWFIKKPGVQMTSPFEKATFKEKFINGIFDPIENIDEEEEQKSKLPKRKVKGGIENGKRSRSGNDEKNRQSESEETAERLDA